MTATENPTQETLKKRGCRSTRFLLRTLEPVHIGTGAYRLGRVDNPIAREPATHLPKIPGTSLHGALRSYAARKWADDSGSTVLCAGVGAHSEDAGETETGRKKKPHCGKDDCPVCYTFGHVKKDDQGNSGVVSVGDARLLLFPIRSMAGPVWVTSVRTLEDSGLGTETLADANKVRLGSDLLRLPRLNLGWLMVASEGALDTANWRAGIPDFVRNRTVLVDDALFSRLVNGNLEVRTSVAIDPDTGAASEGALFTYEAIPRAAWLWMDVIEDDYREKPFAATNGWKSPLDVVKAGFSWMTLLGVGGMGTRGFGRVQAEQWP